MSVDINIFDTTLYGAKRWKSAMFKLEVVVQPIEEKMALILKSKLHTYLGNPRQVLKYFWGNKYILINARRLGCIYFLEI